MLAVEFDPLVEKSEALRTTSNGSLSIAERLPQPRYVQRLMSSSLHPWTIDLRKVTPNVKR